MKSRGIWVLVFALTGVANAEVIYWPDTLWLAREGADSINCIRNLQQIGFAARVWREDHGGQFPSGFEALTNVLGSPAPLCCPANHRAPCPQTFSEVNWTALDYEWLPKFDPNDEQSVFVQCRIHGNIVRISGAPERLFLFRAGWPMVTASPMVVQATPGETVRFEVRLAPTTLAPVYFQWEKVDLQGASTVIPQAHDPVFVITNVNANDAMLYRVAMSNAMGIAVSSPARLTVTADLKNPATDVRTAEILCVSRLHSIALAARIWANDTQHLPGSFADMRLGWPLILYCPWDTNHAPAAEWDQVDSADVSYELIAPTADLEDESAPYCRCKVHGFIVEAGGRVRWRPQCDGFCITSFNVEADSVTITWRSQPGETYYIDFKAALTDPDWTPVSGGIIAQGTQASWTGLRVTARAFYRVAKLN